MRKSWGFEQFKEPEVKLQDQDKAKEEKEKATKGDERGEVSTEDHTRKILFLSLFPPSFAHQYLTRAKTLSLNLKEVLLSKKPWL